MYALTLPVALATAGAIFTTPFHDGNQEGGTTNLKFPFSGTGEAA